ncbi:CPBP family intramembrane glutamic endopeptidase [Natrialbaceae archaeon A-CW3]
MTRAVRTVLTSIRNLLWNETQGRARAPWRILIPLLAILGASTVVISILFDRVSLPVLLTATQMTLAVAAVAAIAVTSRYLDRGRTVWQYGLRADRRWGRDLLAGFVLAASAVGIPYIVGIAMGWYEVSETFAVGHVGFWVALGLVVVWSLGTGLWEELFFRGVFMTNAAEGLRGWLSPKRALIVVLAVQTVLFGVIHIDHWTAQAPHPAFVVTWIFAGLVYGVLYLLSNDLAFPIAAHAGGNAAGASLISATDPADSGWSVLVFVEPASEAILLGHGGAMMFSTNVLVLVFGIAWLRYSREESLELWSHPAFFVTEQDDRGA